MESRQAHKFQHAFVGAHIPESISVVVCRFEFVGPAASGPLVVG